MEIWKQITIKNNRFKDFYEVSNLGRVRSWRRYLDRRRRDEPIILCQSYDKAGYCSVVLCDRQERVNFKVHRLVAHEFISNFQNRPDVNHIDFDKKNNKLDNLQWVTKSENVMHSVRAGKWGDRSGEKNGANKWSEAQIRIIVAECNEGILFKKDVAKKYNMNSSHLSEILNGKRWKHLNLGV